MDTAAICADFVASAAQSGKWDTLLYLIAAGAVAQVFRGVQNRKKGGENGAG